MYSYIGKSTIKQNLYVSFSNKSKRFPSSIRTSPAIFCTVSSFSSATKNKLSPVFAPNFSSKPFLTSSVTNLAIPPCGPSSVNFTQARPFAPASSTAYSVILSKNFLPCSAPFGTTTAFIVLSLNALNSVSLKISVASCIISGFLKSGLSIPYFSIASLYGIFINGPSSTFHVVNFLKVDVNISSSTSKTSS